jgi:hypothetical protein
MGVFAFKPTKGPNQAKNGKTSSFGTFTIHIVYLIKVVSGGQK